MLICPLADRPEALPTVARWLFERFGYLNPGASLERSERRMTERLKREGCPIAFVAFEGDVPTGTASLVPADLEERPDLAPWLAGVFVEPARRGHGIGSALVGAVVAHAGRCGYENVYLFTPDKQAFFARLGWKERESSSHHGTAISVMERASRRAE
jgi:predicted N-acetyltransferase YhbS